MSGLEGNPLQGIQRPAECRRVPSTPPEKPKGERKFAFFLMRRILDLNLPLNTAGCLERRRLFVCL